MRHLILITVSLVSMTFNSGVASGNPLGRVARETVEWAAKKFGKRTLTRASREAAETALEKAARQHGDDVFNVVRRGGLEAIEQGARHGDDFWHLAKRYPSASRSLALHADDLLPAARRVGPELIELEAKNPGLGLKVVQSFGDDGARVLAKAPQEHIPRLIGYAGKAPDAATRRAFLDHYMKSGNKRAFLDAFNWKHVMAAGLSTALVVTAYQVSDGVQTASINESVGTRDGLRVVAKEHPEVFADLVKDRNRSWAGRLLDGTIRTLVIGMGVLLALLLIPVAAWSWRRSRRAAQVDTAPMNVPPAGPAINSQINPVSTPNAN